VRKVREVRKARIKAKVTGLKDKGLRVES